MWSCCLSGCWSRKGGLRWEVAWAFRHHVADQLALVQPVAGNRADAGHDAASSVEVVVEITPQEGLMVRGPVAQEVKLLDVVLDGPLETVGAQVRAGEGVLEGRDPQSG